MTELHCLLVGIDDYDSRWNEEVGRFGSLNGAVRDAERIAELLAAEPLAVPPERIRKLVAPVCITEDERPDRDDLPTYRNLCREIEALGRRAPAGSQVLIHFSGHGAQVASRTGGKTWDECLVPCDAARTGDLLRDVEIHGLLQDLAARDLAVTLLIDSCHSGGVLRGEKVTVRSAGRLTGEWGPEVPATAPSWSELAERWRPAEAERRARTRSVEAAPLLPVPAGCVLLAACRPGELARECHFEGIGSSGALTHFFLEATGAVGPQPTYRELHAHLLARIHGRFDLQTPLLEGDGDRRLFGLDRWPSLRGVPILESVGEPVSRVRLATGRAQGIRAEARFELRPVRQRKGDPETHPEVEVIEAHGTSCWAEVIEGDAGVAPPSDAVGCQAVLVDPGPQALVHGVELVREDAEAGAAVLDELRRRLEAGEESLLELTPEASADDLRVAADPCTEGLVVCDGSGEPLPHQGEPVPWGDPTAADRLLERLRHVARFRNVRNLGQENRTSQAHDALELRLQTADGTHLQSGVAAVGETVELVVTNRSQIELDVVVLDLQPDWGISRVHPHPAEARFVSVGAGDRTVARLTVALPERMDQGDDVLKVFATADSLDFSWLELPALGAAPRTRKHRHEPRNDLERLLAQVAAEQPPRRNAEPHRTGSDWTVRDVLLEVRRHGGTAEGAPAADLSAPR